MGVGDRDLIDVGPSRDSRWEATLARRHYGALLSEARHVKRKLLALLLGLLTTLVALELGIRVGYRSFVRAQARANLSELQPGDDAIRVLCMGESTTAVAADPEGRLLVTSSSYPAQLQEILSQRPTTHRYEVLNIGMMGGSSGSSLALLEDTLPALKPQIIVAMMGIKDTPSERLPGLGALPGWLAALRTVQLAAWVLESLELQLGRIDTEVDTVAEIPESLDAMDNPLRNYGYEPRLDDLPPAQRESALEGLRLGLYYWYIGRLARAEQLLSQVTVEHDLGYPLLARVQVSAGRRGEARETLELAMALHPDDAFYPLVLGGLLAEDGEPLAAIHILEELVENADRYRQRQVFEPHLLVALADALREAGDHQRALEVLTRVDRLKIDLPYKDTLPPIKFRKQLTRGHLYLDMGQLELAEEQLTLAVQQAPRRHVAMFLLSEVYRRQGRFDEEEAIRRGLLDESVRLAEYFELAKMYRREGHPERAEELVADAVERIPSLRRSYRELYAVAQRNGIHLVVMQYPSFGLELLHRYAPPAPGVSFIDNEHLFDADPDGYFFAPTFPHSFSHYTHDGARLLADHVADHLLAELEPDAAAAERAP
jgi:tetratricopeptide (TPR) repeat protein